jgi:hypothetical protein
MLINRIIEIADSNAGWNLDLRRLQNFANVIIRCIDVVGSNRPLLSEVHMRGSEGVGELMLAPCQILPTYLVPFPLLWL